MANKVMMGVKGVKRKVLPSWSWELVTSGQRGLGVLLRRKKP